MSQSLITAESRIEENGICSVVASRENDLWYECIPISINCAYGDPLMRVQIEDTCFKLHSLINHKAPVGFCTKGILSDFTLKRLQDTQLGNNVVIRYSLTGLNEAGFTFAKRVKTIYQLCDVFGKENVIISPRPIIPGRNDHFDNLRDIVEVAKDTGRKLIIGGLHNEFKHKTVAQRVENTLLDLCDKNGIKVFYKSSCASAYTKKTNCWMHDLGTPQNLDVIRSLGYEFDMHDGKILLPHSTTGDLNFVRMVTASYVTTRKLHNNYNLLSFSTNEKEYETTSSWYAWARNIPHCLGCDYCIINDIEYLEQSKKDIGSHPRDILGFTQRNTRQGMPEMERGEFLLTNDQKTTDKGVLGYQSARIPKPCLTHAYKKN